MTYPAIGSVLLPKRGRRHLPALTVRQIHRPDHMVTVRDPQAPKGRRTLKVSELRKDYNFDGVVE